MESFKLLASVLLLITEAHAWGAQSSSPVDCLVTGWTSWSEPVFADTAIRTRSVIQTSAHGGIECPYLLEISNNTGSQVTTKKVADEFTHNFFNPYVVRRSRTIRRATFGKRRDLLVVLDLSGSIGADNFYLAINHVADLLSFLCPTSSPFEYSMHKLAIIRNTTVIFDFNKYNTTISTLQAVRGIKYITGETDTAAAFNLAKKMFVREKGARLDENDVKQEVLILTDRHSNNATEAIRAAKSLQAAADVYVLVIGELSGTGRDEVMQYVSDPIRNHLFSLPSFKKLSSLVQYMRAALKTFKCAPFDLR